MKIHPPLWRIAFLLFAWFAGLRDVHAQAPGSITGSTFDFVVTGATFPYNNSGHYRFLALNSGSQYRIFNVRDSVDSQGVYNYSRPFVEKGIIQYDDSLGGPGFGQVLNFQTSLNGNFVITNANFNGTQSGAFLLFPGTAPQSMGNKIVTLAGLEGTGPLSSNGVYRLVTLANGSFFTETTVGISNSWGTFSYALQNRSSGMVTFSDNQLGTGFYLFSFSTDVSGTFLVRVGGFYQIGTFTIVDLRPIVFATQPVGRSVIVGNSVRLAASVTGTQPIFYQWYKNELPIAGATNNVYNIAFAQLSDAGSYRLVARNAAGSVSSATVVVTVQCGYTLSPTVQSFAAAGGEGSVLVGATGTCSWTVSNAPAWVSITSATSGSGVATVTFTVQENTGDLPRVATLSIGGKPFTVAQLGKLAPASLASKTLILTQSESSGAFDYGESYFLQIRKSDDQFHVQSRTETLITDSGSVQYERISGNHISMVLPRDGNPIGFDLAFDTATTGSYSATNNSGVTQAGSFVLLNALADFNLDGFSDLAFQRGDRVLVSWVMNGTTFLSSRLLKDGRPANVGWRAAGLGDFNADHYADVLFQHETGRLSVWRMQGSAVTSVALLTGGPSPGLAWRAVSATDFNDDGKSDILFEHRNGQMAIWYYDNTGFIVSALLHGGIPAGTNWRALGSADFNGDGQMDILFQHSSGKLRVWYLVAGNFVGSALLRDGEAPGIAWRAVGLDDFNQDGAIDVLFRHTTGKFLVWFMNDQVFLGKAPIRPGVMPAGWRVVGPK
jgi:hypothetical protein